MKEIIDAKEDDFKFEYGNFPEDLNCSIIFSKMDLKSVQVCVPTLFFVICLILSSIFWRNRKIWGKFIKMINIYS